MFNFKKFKKRKLVPINPENVGKYQVIEVDPAADGITGCLGMSEERAKTLGEVTIHAFHTSKNVVEAISKVSKECNHANELYFTSMVLTEFHYRSNMANKMMSMIDKKAKGE